MRTAIRRRRAAVCYALNASSIAHLLYDGEYGAFHDALITDTKWLGGCRGVLLSPALRMTGFEHSHREAVSQLGFSSENIIATL
jgi:hypothetical protein